MNNVKNDSHDFSLEENEEELLIVLDEFDVELPDESVIRSTVEVAQRNMPKKPRQNSKVAPLLNRAMWEFLNVTPFFMIVNLLFFCTGVLFILFSQGDPYLTMMMLAPLPFLIGLIDIMRIKHTGMAELEATLPYTLHEVVFSKLLIVAGYNLILNMVMTVIIPFFGEGILIWRLVFFWMAPFTLISAVSLWLASVFRNRYAGAAVPLVLWTACGSGVLMNEELPVFLKTLPVEVCLPAITVGVLGLAHQIYRIKRGKMTDAIGD